jgi:hypothetical protein
MWKEEYTRLLGNKKFISTTLNKVPRCKVRFTPIFKIMMEIALHIHVCVRERDRENYVHWMGYSFFKTKEFNY